MASPIHIFLCYAHEDRPFLEALEQHLAPLKRLGLITSWHNRDIGTDAIDKQEIDNHSITAQIVLLLVSPGFMASDYCYHIEMKRALVRQQKGECRVIPVIVRPVHWRVEPLGALKVLPSNELPIASWSDRDEALLDVVTGICRVMEEMEASSLLAYSPVEQQENGEKIFQTGDIPAQTSLPEGSPMGNDNHQKLADPSFREKVSQIFIDRPHKMAKKVIHPQKKNRRRNKMLVSIAVPCSLLFLSFVIVFAFLRLVPFSSSNLQPTRKPSSQSISASVIKVLSSAMVLPDNLKQFSAKDTLLTRPGAILIGKDTSSSYNVILDVQNMLQGDNYIVLNSIVLKIHAIPEISGPQKVYAQVESTTTYKSSYPYPVFYTDQTAGQLLLPQPPLMRGIPIKVELSPEENNQLSIQVHSQQMVFLQFQIQISYETTNPDTGPRTLLVPTILQVMFLKAQYWQEYISPNGFFVRKP